MKRIFLFFSVGIILVNTSSSLAAEVRLAWNPSPSAKVTGYLIYYGTSSGNHPQCVDADNSTQHKLQGLNDGTTYYFVACAYRGSCPCNDPSCESSDSKEISWKAQQFIADSSMKRMIAYGGPANGFEVRGQRLEVRDQEANDFEFEIRPPAPSEFCSGRRRRESADESVSRK